MKQTRKQIERQLGILRTLEANRFGKSARELAAEYEVDRKLYSAICGTYAR